MDGWVLCQCWLPLVQFQDGPFPARVLDWTVSSGGLFKLPGLLVVSTPSPAPTRPQRVSPFWVQLDSVPFHRHTRTRRGHMRGTVARTAPAITRRRGMTVRAHFTLLRFTHPAFPPPTTQLRPLHAPHSLPTHCFICYGSGLRLHHLYTHFACPFSTATPTC